MKKLLITLMILCILVLVPACEHNENTINESTVIPNVTSQSEEATTEPVISEEEVTSEQEVLNQEFTLTFVGDCTLGTMPKWMSHSLCFNRLIGDNYDFPFQNVRHYFETDDCTFINLESVLAESGTPENKTFTFMGPTAYVNILTGSSVEFANLSNNHTYDFGEAGYTSTKHTLDSNNVAYVEMNNYALYTTESGLKIGVYGVYFELDENDMLADITELKNAGAEIIVAAAHWGIESDYVQNSTQTNIAYQLIDAGVDIVWGHHPHVLQPIEEYNDGVIFYSLGNFSFGGNHNPVDRDTAVIQQKIIRDENGEVSLGELIVIPCSVSSESAYNNFQPTPYEEGSEGYQRVLSKLNR